MSHMHAPSPITLTTARWGRGNCPHFMPEPSEAQRSAEAYAGRTKPGSGPAKRSPGFWSVKRHPGLGLQPRELLPQREHCQSEGAHLLPPPTAPATCRPPVSHGAGSGACGGASPGRLCREPWELHLVGGGRGCTRVQVHTRARSLALPPLSAAPPEAGQPAGSAAPRLGAHVEKSPPSSTVRNGRKPGDQPDQSPTSSLYVGFRAGLG